MRASIVIDIPHLMTRFFFLAYIGRRMNSFITGSILLVKYCYCLVAVMGIKSVTGTTLSGLNIINLWDGAIDWKSLFPPSTNLKAEQGTR